MARVTAVIDIGSNSARMVIFERTSRFGFYLLKEIKSRVRISEGTYENGGYLQEAAIERAVKALSEFLSIAKAHKASKVICVATSAVRDAPNRGEFLSLVRRKVGINIKVIDGQKEAFFGAVAALNMLKVEDAITVDIGGGSTEIALIKDGKIEELISLNLGTVRLKELIFDKNLPLSDALVFVDRELSKLSPKFNSETIIGIGGTNRALASAIMELESYPINTLHGFEFSLTKKREFLDEIISSKLTKLKNFKIKPERYDVIREGALIIKSIIDRVGAKKMIASGVGVREGVFLSDILRNDNGKFPKNFSPSLRSLLDRFAPKDEARRGVAKCAKKIFEVLTPLHNLSQKELTYLICSAKLLNIGTYLNFYNHRYHSYYFILNNLDYGYTHLEKLIIASIVKYHGKRFSKLDDDIYKDYLIEHERVIKWLTTILSIAEALTIDRRAQKMEFSLSKNTLVISCEHPCYLAQEKLKRLLKGSGISLAFNTLSKI